MSDKTAEFDPRNAGGSTIPRDLLVEGEEKPENGRFVEALEERLGIDLGQESRGLESVGAEERVAWVLKHFNEDSALTSSFGAQSAVLLHMVTRQWPGVPVILLDTGYLFPETYQFIDELTERLALNLKVFRAELSPAWQEAKFGKLWEQGVEGIERYNQMNKVEPMSRALDAIGVDAWMAGLRRSQSSTRKGLSVLATVPGRLKVHPLADWSDRDVFQYLNAHGLPYHPLWENGYVSIGDWHTTARLDEGMTEEDTRFFGLKRECGIHENTDYVI